MPARFWRTETGKKPASPRNNASDSLPRAASQIDPAASVAETHGGGDYQRRHAQGLRRVQHWVPDLRKPEVLAEIRREVALMAQHPENDAIDQWIEAAYDWTAWE